MSSNRIDCLTTWFAALQSSKSGTLMLTNVLFAFRTQRPTQETLRELLAAVASNWSPDGGRRADTLVETIADDKLKSAICGAPRSTASRCARVIDAYSFVTNNIKVRETGFGISDEVPPSLLAQLEAGIREDLPKGEIRGRRPLAWVTRKDHLDALRQHHGDPDEAATVVRNQLGLSHYNQDQLLLEIEYPDEVNGSLECAAPTFLEGGAGVVFRARTCADAWGRAVDLDTMGDGLPEAVHRPIAFTASFRIQRIGRPLSAPGFDFQKVIDAAEFPWGTMPPDFWEFVKACVREWSA
jgi:hypothetical protein